jgi:hypothetical protein
MPGNSKKSRGGVRPGAGRPYKWVHGPTKLIRVPIALANDILQYARDIDSQGGFPTPYLQSQSVKFRPDSELARENKHLRHLISSIYAHHEREEMLKRMKARFKQVLTGKDEFGNEVDWDAEIGPDEWI